MKNVFNNNITNIDYFKNYKTYIKQFKKSI